MRNGLICMLTAGMLVAGGATSVAGEVDTNASLDYYRAWMTMNPDLPGALDSSGDEHSVAQGHVTLLLESAGDIEALLQASRIGGADWAVNIEDGPGAAMPHLGKMRGSAKAIAADAIRCADAGDRAGAAERVAALYNMSGHVTGDRLLISSLVGMAIANLGNELSVQFIEQGVFGQAEAMIVLEGIHRLDERDPCGIHRAIVGEWRIISEYVLTHADGDDAGAWLIGQFQAAGDTAPGRAIRRMDQSALLGELGGFSQYHGVVLAAWARGDADGLKQAEQKLTAGAYGSLAELVGGSYTRAFASTQRFDSELADLVERLEEIGD
jgi:hypothetical protein